MLGMSCYVRPSRWINEQGKQAQGLFYLTIYFIFQSRHRANEWVLFISMCVCVCGKVELGSMLYRILQAPSPVSFLARSPGFGGRWGGKKIQVAK